MELLADKFDQVILVNVAYLLQFCSLTVTCCEHQLQS